MGNENAELRETLGRIETKLDIALKDIADHECRLRVIEGKSGIRWETLLGQISGLFVAAVIGWLLGRL